MHACLCAECVAKSSDWDRLLEQFACCFTLPLLLHTVYCSNSLCHTEILPHTVCVSHSLCLTKIVPHRVCVLQELCLTQCVPHRDFASQRLCLTQLTMHTADATHPFIIFIFPWVVRPKLWDCPVHFRWTYRWPPCLKVPSEMEVAVLL